MYALGLGVPKNDVLAHIVGDTGREGASVCHGYYGAAPTALCRGHRLLKADAVHLVPPVTPGRVGVAAGFA
jgi:hypothetical protein